MKQTHLAIAIVLTLVSAATPALAQETTATVTRVYRVDAASVESISNELKRTFRDNPNVRIAAERSSGRIVIVAPQEVHTELLPRLRGAGLRGEDLVEPSQIGNGTNGLSSPNAQRAQQFTLRHLTASDLRKSIVRFYAGRVPSQRSQDGLSEWMTVGGNAGSAVRLQLDYSTNEISLSGPSKTVEAWLRLVQVLDRPQVVRDEQTQLVSIQDQHPRAVRRAMELIKRRANNTRRRPATRTDIIQWGTDKTQPVQVPPMELAQVPNQPPQPVVPQPGALPANPPKAAVDSVTDEGLVGPVQIEYLDGLDVIVLRGKKEDVDRVSAIIKEIEDLSVVTEPAIEVVDLEHVDSEAMAEIVRPLHEEVLSIRQGRVSITPLVKPNSLLLVGRPESVKVVKELIEKLDRPSGPDKQFHVFQLQYLSATEAEQLISNFYEERGGLGTRVRIVSDYRSNSVIVQASPRDASEVRTLLTELDVSKGAAINEIRVFRLKNSLAEDLVPVLQEALTGTGGTQSVPGDDGTSAIGRSTTLSLTTVDAMGQRQYQSGVQADVQVTADSRANSIVVRGPAESMDLIGALIRQLDGLPSEDAEIKVFTIIHGDAILLADVLGQLFGTQTGAGGGFQSNQDNSIALHPLIPLRFSVDERTNSIVASGSLADLQVVEAILLRLDEENVEQRKSSVYRLRYAPALDVATAIADFLRSERQIQEVDPSSLTPFQQIEREVVVVPEPVSNSLLLSATPQYFDEVYKLIEELDARPPMVMIQVLIAEVDLDRFYELGAEMGIQDPLLFDRSVLTDVITPGFNFNNRPLGNANNASSFLSAGMLGAQALGNFALGRTNSQLGFGGLVLSASSDAFSALLRALEVDARLHILSRPQVMTLDNQPAFVQVGQRVPRITSSQLTINGTINNTVLENVGLLLGVTPRISPDGLVVMEVNAEKSKLGNVDEGIPISININGDVIRSPIIDITTAQTTVSARSGQTVVIGGLISESTIKFDRRVPFLTGIPIIGELFRYQQEGNERKELLIILTPYIVKDDQDVDCINQIETERMSWCLNDVFRIHGCFDVNNCDRFSDGTRPYESCQPGSSGPVTIYPDRDPTGGFSPVDEFDSSFDVPTEMLPPHLPSPEVDRVPTAADPELQLRSPGAANSLPARYQMPVANSPTGRIQRANHQLLVPKVPARDPRGTRPYTATMQPAAELPQTFIARGSQWSSGDHVMQPTPTGP